MRLTGRFAIIASAGVVGQALAVLVSPILSRYVTPVGFGVAGSLLAVNTIASAVSTGRLEEVIPESGLEHERRRLSAVAATIATIVASAVFVILLLAPSQLKEALSAKQLVALTGVTAVHLWFTGLLAVLTANALARGDVRSVGRTHIQRSVAKAITTLALAFRGAGYNALMLGVVVEQAAGGAALLRYKWWNVSNSRAFATLGDVWQTVRKHQRLAQLSLTALLRTSNNALVVLSLGGAFGIDAMGIIALAQRLTLGPAAMIANAAYQAILSLGARWDLESLNERSRVVSGLAGLVALSLALALLGSWIFTPDRLSALFGREWERMSDILPPMIMLSGCYIASLPAEKLMEQLGGTTARILLELLRLTLLLVVPPVSVAIGLSLSQALVVVAAGSLAATLVGLVRTRSSIAALARKCQTESTTSHHSAD